MSLSKILLTELADINNVYDYKIRKDKPSGVIYSFKTETDIEYRVGFYYQQNNVWSTGFDSMVSRQGKVVNAEKVLNTVFAVVKDFYEDNKEHVDTLLFHADKKRERIYRYYVDKLFPTAEINPEGYDPNAFVVSIK